VGGVASLVIIAAIVIIVARQLTAHGQQALPRVVVTPAPEAKAVAPVADDDAVPSAGPSLVIDAEPEALVLVDGKKIGNTPQVVPHAPGKVVVELRAEGYRPHHEVLTLGATDHKMTIKLEHLKGAKGVAAPAAHVEPAGAPKEAKEPKEAIAAKPAKEPAADEESGEAAPSAGGGGLGFLSITTDPWARVWIDGKDTGRSTPIVKMSVPAGKHHLELKTRTSSVAADVVVGKGRVASITKTID